VHIRPETYPAVYYSMVNLQDVFVPIGHNSQRQPHFTDDRDDEGMGVYRTRKKHTCRYHNMLHQHDAHMSLV
jgi:hypothetical protein